MADVVLDTGALLAVERGSARVAALLREVGAAGASVVVPAGALAQAWRDGARQARIARLLASPRTVVEPLDAASARAAGVLCGATGSSDIVDASVALAAARRRCPVLTSDPQDLARLTAGRAGVRVVAL